MPTVDQLVRSGRQALRTGRREQALAQFRKALALDPGSVAAVKGLTRTFRAAGQNVDALQVIEPLLATGRADAGAWLLAAKVLLELGEAARAFDACRQGLALTPELAGLHHSLGMAAYALGEADLAVTHLGEAYALKDRIQSLIGRTTILPGAPGVSPQEVLDARRAVAIALAKELAGPTRARPGPFDNPRPRIGYLSSHFPNENYMKPVWALLNHHDREAFELHLFSDARKSASTFPGFRKHSADFIHPVGSLDTVRLAKLIARQRIDLLIDLNSYSTVDRLALFLSPPAPVVATWFNAFATSGLPGIDVLIGDDETVRPDEEEFYSERIVRLPLSYLTFEVTHPVPPVADPPCLGQPHLTFGSLVTQYKITPPVLDAWAAILRRAPGSRLILANKTLKSRENADWLLQQFAAREVTPERLDILPPAPHLEFLGYYDRIDLALDAFPYNGGTTTMEALWQGVPVLTFDGDRWASRTSQTILRRTHLPEFVSPSVEAMVDHAVALATAPGTPERLTAMRHRMREDLKASSACDGPALARAMEDIYRDLLRR